MSSSPFQQAVAAKEPPVKIESEEDIERQQGIDEREREANARKTHSEANEIETMTRVKEALADRTFNYMQSFSIFAALVFWIYISSLLSQNKTIPDNVMIAFLTTTVATVLGLVGFILKGLFGQK